MNIELAHLSLAEREALQSGEGEPEVKVELAVCDNTKKRNGSPLPQDIAAVRELIFRACEKERQLQHI